MCGLFFSSFQSSEFVFVLPVKERAVVAGTLVKQDLQVHEESYIGFVW